MSSVGKKPSRRPADQAGAGRQEIWAAIRACREAIAVGPLVRTTGLHRSTITRYLNALTRAGYLEHEPAATGLPGKWALRTDAGYHAPRIRPDGTDVELGEASAQLWRGMDILKEFSYLDLVQGASITIPHETAKAYCKFLLACGYLRVIEPTNYRRGRIARYRLIRNLGPIPPQIQRVKRIYDPNTGEVFWPGDGEDGE